MANVRRRGGRGARRAKSASARRPTGMSSQIAQRLREFCESIEGEEEGADGGCTVHITDCVISPQQPNAVLLRFPRGVKVDVDRLKRFADVVYKEFYEDRNPPSGGGAAPRKPDPGKE